jgi:hypothetical protein
MKRLFVIIACLRLLFFGTDIKADVSSEMTSNSSSPITRKYPTVLVGGNGLKGDDVAAERLREQLKNVPRIEIVFIKSDEVLIHVWGYRNEKGEVPASLPPEARALPSTFEGRPVKVIPLYVMPPPPGVIVLKPEFEYEQATSCPPSYYETEEKGWRFCNNSSKPEGIPPIMSPPVAGMPYLKAYQIYNRHRKELSALPGTGAISLGERGIIVEASDASQIPREVEGLPIEVLPIRRERDSCLVTPHRLKYDRWAED